MKVLATYSIKGDVGKTVTSVNLAYLSAREGYNTLYMGLRSPGSGQLLLINNRCHNISELFLITYPFKKEINHA
jgi:cellulose biosynthesis protein BcsQ